MGAHLSSYSVLRKVRHLEKVFMAGREEEWIDVVMWGTEHRGVFGHGHIRFEKHSGRSEWKPCSDEEEVELMKRSYEDEEHRMSGRTEPVSFAEYLEYFSYLGPEELSERRKQVIEQFRT
jgi:hypothetical protein